MTTTNRRCDRAELRQPPRVSVRFPTWPVILFTLILRADFEPSAWKFRRPLPIPTPAPIATLAIDRAIYTRSQPTLADLRVLNGAEETPYVLERMSGSDRRAEVPSRITNQGVTDSGDLEITIDAGVSRHNGVRISTRRTNFRQRVAISTSDDGVHWTRIRDHAFIFDFTADGRQVSILNVPYPPSTRRYLRLTIYQWTDPKAVDQLWLTMEQTQPPVRDLVAALAANPVEDPKTQSSLYTWDLGDAGVPHDQLSVDVTTPAFDRAAAIESSRDGADWSQLAAGVLSRFGKEQSLTLDFPSSRDRYLRLRIYNRDDRPLAVKSATLTAIRTRLLFKPAAGATYWLYYGNLEARAPSYDLPALLARETPGAEIPIAPGPAEPNPAYREKLPPPKPWSEQHPAILYVTLALAVLGMGIITIRFLRKAAAETPLPS
jgi:Protein of unknown function (DUF3999)